MNRMSSVALAVRRLDPNIRLLFIVDGASHGFLDALQMPYVALPYSGTVFNKGCWDSWRKHEKKNLLNTMVSSILAIAPPRLVVYDCFPSEHMLDLVIQRNIHAVLCIRKMRNLDEYLHEPNVARVLQSGADIIVPHERSDFSLPSQFESRTTYVGDVVRPLPVDPQPVQTRFHISNKKIIVISTGGGGHKGAVSYLNLCLRAVTSVRQTIDDIEVVLVTGPLFTGWDSLELTAGVHVVPFDIDFTSTCATADLVVSQAGYNSVQEILALGTPTICVPVIRSFDDQFERARAAAASCPSIDYFESEDVNTLAALMERKLLNPTPRVRRQEPNGAQRAAIRLIQMLETS